MFAFIKKYRINQLQIIINNGKDDIIYKLIGVDYYTPALFTAVCMSSDVVLHQDTLHYSITAA